MQPRQTFGVWLPPGTEHVARADGETSYFVLDIDADLCARLPRRASVLSVSAIAKAVFLDLQKRQVRKPQSPEDVRLMEVLIDQLSASVPVDSFLPMSSDAALRNVLEALCKNPGDSRTLVEWARYVHSTERTLARRCTRDLGMTFLEWRQRLRLSRAFAMLADGLAVQVVAQQLGYGTTSAFIAMFPENDWHYAEHIPRAIAGWCGAALAQPLSSPNVALAELERCAFSSARKESHEGGGFRQTELVPDYLRQGLGCVPADALLPP